MSASVRIENLTVAYDRVPAIHHLSATFAPGSLTAIAGPNGSGKSTLLAAIMGLVTPDSGTIAVEGIARNRIAYLPQRTAIDPSFPISVFDAASLGLWHEMGRFGGITCDGRARVRAALDAVGLAGEGSKLAGALSAGQFQRMLFARLMLQGSPLILLDEPFTGLDTTTTDDLLARIAAWHREGRTVIAVLHDMPQIRAHFPDLLLLAKGGARFGPSRDVLNERVVAQAAA